MKRRAAGLLGFALATTASDALAETRAFGTARVDVTMPIDPSCPTDVEVLDGLGAALGPMPTGEPSTTFRVRAEMSSRGTVGTVEGRGETRRVAGATCHEVAEAIALVLVLSIEARASSSVELPVVSPAPRRPVIPPPPPLPAPLPPAPPSVLPISYGAAASAGLVTGLLPSPAGLGTVAVVLRHGHLPLEARIGIGAFLPARLHVSRGELTFRAFRALASVCGSTPERLSFGLCTGITVDTVLTSASNFPENPDTSAAIPSLTLGPTLRYALGPRLSFGADAEAGVILAPTRWQVMPIGTVHSTAALEGRLGFFGEIRFW